MDDPTIPSNDRYIQYTYSGGDPVFNYDFPVYDASSVSLYINNTKMRFTEDYTVTISSDFDGGTLTILRTLEENDLITIVGNTPLVRTEKYSSQPVVSPSALDAENSKTIMRLQQLNTKLLGCLQNAITETEAGNTILPLTADRKGKVAAWDETTGALTYFGNNGMDEIYLQRENNLSDLSDVEAARDNLNIIDGRQLANNGTAIDYRSILEFDKAFKLINAINKTVVGLALTITNVGNGLPLVTKFSENTIWARTIRATGNITISLASDGSLLLQDRTVRGKIFHFFVTDWSSDGKITITSERHKISNDDTVIVTVRNSDGYTVNCNTKISSNGDVTIESSRPFDGSAFLYGGISPILQSGAILIDPMEEPGDLIIRGNDVPQRLPIGQPDQVLAVNDTHSLEYTTLGKSAWKDLNVPYGVPQLDDNGMIPAETLPISTMTHKGTFGSTVSSTGGDLPSTGVLDGDIYICDEEDYYSTVAGKTFAIGQWAIYDGSGWDAIPVNNIDPAPVGSVTAFCGTAIPKYYLSCNGYKLNRISYPELFNVIGTTYNTGSESDTEFSIPNYNNERLFLQGSNNAGEKHSAGLPNITGTLPNMTYRSYLTPVGTGALRVSSTGFGSNTTDGLNNYEVSFDASLSSAIYGASDTVQPPSQDVVFLIKYK